MVQQKALLETWTSVLLSTASLLEMLIPVILTGDAEVQLNVQESLRGAVGICIRDRTEGIHPYVHVLHRCAAMMSDEMASAKTHVLAEVMASGIRPVTDNEAFQSRIHRGAETKENP